MYQQNFGHDDSHTDEIREISQRPAYLNDESWSRQLLPVGENPGYGLQQYNASAYVPPTITPYFQNYTPSDGYTNQRIQPMDRKLSYNSEIWPPSRSFDPNFPCPTQDLHGLVYHENDGTPPSIYAATPDIRYEPMVPFGGSASFPPAMALPPRYQDLPPRRTSHSGGPIGQNGIPQMVETAYDPRQQYPPAHVSTPTFGSRQQPGSFTNSPSMVSPDMIEPESPPPATGEDFIQDSFPEPTDEHDRLRGALTEVMNSDWRRAHIMEPDEELLLQFTSYNRRLQRWSCCFSRDGKLCDRSTRKKDHAKGHIRWHIDHRPFFCRRPCPAGDPNCNKQYTAMESLKKHQTGRAECNVCGASMLKGNLQRHRLSSCKAPVV